MEEQKLITRILVFSTIIALVSILVLAHALEITGKPIESLEMLESLESAVVTRYDSVFYNGYILEINITYLVKNDGLNMVYYFFRSPLALNASGRADEIIVLDLKCPQGLYGYVVDSNGVLHTSLRGEQRDKLAGKLETAKAINEAGCYSPSGLVKGKYYTVTYRFLLIPDKAYSDGGSWMYFMDIIGKEKHLYIHNLSIRSGYDTRIAVLPPFGSGEPVSTYNIDYLSGVSGLRLAIISTVDAPRQIPVIKVDNVYNVLSEETGTRLRYGTIAWLLNVTPIILAIMSPGALYLLYLGFGRERPPESAIPYGYPPNTGEKPWEVAAIYGTSPGKLTYNVVVSVLLDLYRRGLITVDPQKKKITSIGVGDLDALENIILTAALKGWRYTRSLRDAVEIVSKKAGEAIEGSYRYILYIIAALGLGLGIAGAILYSETLYTIPAKTTLLGLILLFIAYGPSLKAPRYLFGRWKPGYRERAIAWNDFARRKKQPQEEAIILPWS